MSQISTHIGVTFFDAQSEFPCQPAIVLSSDMRFNGTVLCGTIAQTVNGRAVQWKECLMSPAVFDTCLRVVGIIKVATVCYAPLRLLGFIHGLQWTQPNVHASSDDRTEPYSIDFVCRVLSYLCNAKVISLPVNVTMDLEGHLTQGLENLKKVQAAQQALLYPIISLVGDEDPIYGQRRS